MIHVVTLSVSRAVNGKHSTINNKLERLWTERVVANPGEYIRIFLEELVKPSKYPSHKADIQTRHITSKKQCYTSKNYFRNLGWNFLK